MSSEMTSINLSRNALKRIKDLLPDHKSNYFRVYVTGGGCSGFQYGFKFDDSPAGDDDIIDFEGFTILLDSLSYPYLYGATLDYIEDLSVIFAYRTKICKIRTIRTGRRSMGEPT